MNSVTIDGVSYNVIRETEFTLGPSEGFIPSVTRAKITMKRPRGKKIYMAIRYENGKYSSVTAIPNFNPNY